MLAKRIIPCLDVNQGRVVKGVNFVNLVDAGDPVALAKFYNSEGADELVFLDITASSDNRKIMLDVVKLIAKEIFIPFTVGGGINNIEQIREIILAGAEKVSLNTAAVKDPEFITKATSDFGSQCIVIAIDAKKTGSSWNVFIKGGREDTGLDAFKWAKQVAELGAGEILLTSMDKDGTKSGFDVELTRKVSEAINIPVIASGGAGKLEDFAQVLTRGKADAALAASLFHFGELKISDLKEYLAKNNIEIRN
ncbi:imidazole glycerol phosphate synthase subunit HisF [Candidatus Daviesbacteria bacterium]|nr:imidazole glycerol phosphate synthase subunit HisF [Candidatus Daviesbacteria bacterium]